MPQQTAISESVGPLTVEVGKRKLWRRWLLRSFPSWMVSFFLHMILVLVLACINIDTLSSVTSLIQAGSATDIAETLEEFVLGRPAEEPDEALESSLVSSETESESTLTFPELDSAVRPFDDAQLSKLELDAVFGKVIPRDLIDLRVNVPITSVLSSRSAQARSEALVENGGTAESEKAVALALKWLSQHQLTVGPMAGSWNFQHGLQRQTPSSHYGQHVAAVNGATGLALLPFLGAGQTHMEGQYQQTVKAGLAFLIKNMKVSNQSGLPCGSWHESQGSMYSHAIAAISMCEAYAMTQDPDLLQPAQLSLNYLIYAQDPRGGGWRYSPQEPGDTSVVGWCLMALKSGSMGRLSVPMATYQRTNLFLDFVSTEYGAFYGYTNPSSQKRRGTTSVGLLSRMFLGWPKEHPSIQVGVGFLSEQGPVVEDLYYSYYATQVMRHFGGPPWTDWNKRMRDSLVESQIKDGDDAGSWTPNGKFHTKEGGRLYQTAMAAMILEVYYRHLPLYKEQSLDAEDFEL